MKIFTRLLCPSIVSLLAILFTGCGSSPSSLIEDMIDVMNEGTEILNGIESKEDYENAKEELKKLGKKIDAIKDKADELSDELSKKEKDELKEEYEDKINDAIREARKAEMKAVKYGYKNSDFK